ncbi:DNA-directed RNA polymerase II [Actinomyces sp. MRS3W]|uniref:DNA-directed RNA polymerase II n=1 Tax=Actinomyces sp. MRS3W TaxID=2800796 RepID=UPI0028FD23BF|nr:DNA-directed RNA polymerase II [Actinomyces sp. MRS3W]MDU0348705.1 DNA-directed RNA polymerase II [Actinomyces sp. MRS3W]
MSPSTIALGGTLTFTLSGFPQGASVDILIDDGMLVPDSDAVVEELTIGEDGTYAGTVELPDYVDKGPHWLRFRVSAGPEIPTNAVRTLDYTNKSPYFTVADVTIIGGEAQANLPAREPTADPTDAAPTAPSAPATSATDEAIASGSGTTSGGQITSSLPVVGTVVGALGAVLVVLSLIIRVERRRLSGYERELEQAARR